MSREQQLNTTFRSTCIIAGMTRRSDGPTATRAKARRQGTDKDDVRMVRTLRRKRISPKRFPNREGGEPCDGARVNGLVWTSNSRSRPVRLQLRSPQARAVCRLRPRWVICAALLPGVIGCVELPPHAKTQMVQAEKEFRSGRYDSAKSMLDEVIQAYPSVLETAEAYYLRAQCLAYRGHRGAAQSDIERCLALSKNSDLIARAHATAGELAFEAGDAKKASEHFRLALRNLPERPPYDLARFRYGVCLAQLGEWKNAREQWGAVVRGYPGSSITDQTQRMLAWPGDFFSIQCGAYRDADTASKQAQKLRSAGHSARTEKRQRDGETLHMVYVGQYLRLSQAQEALGKVKQHAPGAVIVPQ
ncbi:MAG: hypothetical protein DCC66_03410 [Planctomycetota bacterium]|nr:MAG: hypothetical protein DCC66_03410 [Planctomycetota bacterium]